MCSFPSAYIYKVNTILPTLIVLSFFLKHHKCFLTVSWYPITNFLFTHLFVKHLSAYNVSTNMFMLTCSTEENRPASHASAAYSPVEKDR